MTRFSRRILGLTALVDARPPVTGYNHNLKHRGWEFHVQTEDSGISNPHIITHLFHGGTILATKKLVYDPSSAADFVKELMQAQHKALLKELKGGRHDERIGELLGDAPNPEGGTQMGAAVAPLPAASAGTDASINGKPVAAAPVAQAQPPVLTDVPAPPATPPATNVSEAPVSARADALLKSAELEWNTRPATWEPLPNADTRAPSTSLPPLPPPPQSFLSKRATDPQFPSSPRLDMLKPNATPLGVSAAAAANSGADAVTAPRSTTWVLGHRVQEHVYSEVPRSTRTPTSPALPPVTPLHNGQLRVPVMFASIEEAREACTDNGKTVTMLLDPSLDVQLGQDVLLHVTLMDPRGQRLHEMRGIVAWRRHKGRGTLKAGTGITLLPSERVTVDALLGRESTARTHSRVQAAHVTVKVTTSQGTSKKELVDDISEGGLFILSTTPLPVGEEVTLTFKSPNSLFASLDVRARVTWQRGKPDVGMGVQFIFDSEAHKERVEQLVAQLIVQQL